MTEVPNFTETDARARFLIDLFSEGSPLESPPEGERIVDTEDSPTRLEPSGRWIVGDPWFVESIALRDWRYLRTWLAELAVQLENDSSAEHLWTATRICESVISSYGRKSSIGPGILRFPFDFQLRTQVCYALTQCISSQSDGKANPPKSSIEYPPDREIEDNYREARDYKFRRKWLTSSHVNDHYESTVMKHLSKALKASRRWIRQESGRKQVWVFRKSDLPVDKRLKK